MLKLIFTASKEDEKEGGEKMPAYQKCGRKWTWKQTLKKFFTLDHGMTCPYCKTKQYTAKAARIKTAVIPFIAITLLTIGSLLYGPSIAIVFIWISLIPLIALLLPFWLDLSNEDEV